YGMAVSPDGRSLATLDADGVRVWDLRKLPRAAAKPVPLAPPELLLPSMNVREVAFRPDGRYLAVGVGAGVKLVDLTSGLVVADVPAAHPDPIYAVAFDSDGDQLATTDGGGQVRVWEVTPAEGGGVELREQAVLTGHTGVVGTVTFSSSG